MSDEAVFRRSGASFVPGPNAAGPWGSDRLHGGPVLGLVARAIEAQLGDQPDLLLTRLTVDLFRPVPMSALEVRLQVLRQSGRLAVMDAQVYAGEEVHVRASALLMRASDVPASHTLAVRQPSGPEGLETESLMRGFSGSVPPGFHRRVETRWPERDADDPLAIWFHLPLQLVEGEDSSPLVRALALSDFTNAIAGIASQRQPGPTPYINADCTIYLHRRPIGAWFCLQERNADADRGIGVALVTIFDEQGPIGHVLQARIAHNRMR